MIRSTAISLGFDACGIARADELTDDAVFMKAWLEEGQHGDMHYMERNFEKRIDPRVLVPGCKSVVVVLMNYYPEEKQNVAAPQIAKYAYPAIDYHQVLKSKLSKLEKMICATYGPESVTTDYQHSFVDSAPVLERRWAQRAGLGWIGKHTQLIHPGLGTYTFIGVLMLNIDTQYDSPIPSRCGTCTRCIDSCPTKALVNGSLDARRCISYLTIENKKDTPIELLSQLSNNALGCDICADACPWNAKWAQPHQHSELSPTLESSISDNSTGSKSRTMLQWNLETWQQLTKEEFNKTFHYSAIKRAGYDKLKQNINNLKLK